MSEKKVDAWEMAVWGFCDGITYPGRENGPQKQEMEPEVIRCAGFLRSSFLAGSSDALSSRRKLVLRWDRVSAASRRSSRTLLSKD